MIRSDWESIFSLDQTGLIIGYPWYFVTEIEGDWTSLRLTVEGQWDCLGVAVKPCGPDGHPELPLAADRLIVPSAAPGALIGKFGGSNAGRGETGAFVIGSQSFAPMPEKKARQLFISINGATPDPKSTLERIMLKIYGVVDT
jgi:hypothetical protein